MTRRRPLPKLMRAAADAALGLVAFVLLSAILSGSTAVTSFSAWTLTRLDGNPNGMILAVVFSMIVAFNLAFYRHLRRVYASPRRGAWRRS